MTCESVAKIMKYDVPSALSMAFDLGESCAIKDAMEHFLKKGR